MEDDEQININAIVNDTWAVGRVEFFVDGSVIGSATVSPYNERWKITMRNASVDGGVAWPAFVSDDPEVQPGTILEYGDGFAAARTAGGVNLEGHTIKVVAYDKDGNEIGAGSATADGKLGTKPEAVPFETAFNANDVVTWGIVIQ